MTELYFLLSILSIVLSKEMNFHLQSGCGIEINFGNSTQEIHPKLFCNFVCNDIEEKQLNIKKPNKIFYRIEEIEKEINKSVALEIKEDRSVECSLVDVESSSAYVAAPDASIPVSLYYKHTKECGDDYLYFEHIDWCVKISNRTQQWKRVPQACSSEGGVFAIVDTQEKNKAISEYMKTNNIQDVWIALSDTEEEGKFVWIDGTPLSNNSFQNWQTEKEPVQPDDWEKNEDCAHYSKSWDFKWNDVRCDAFFQYLCERKKTYHIPAAPLPAARKGTFACPIGWEMNEAAEACYHIGKERHPFQHSVNYCKKQNGSLASIPKASEMKFVQEMLKKFNGVEDIWIGLNRINTDDPFLWIDGSNLTYESWASGQPDYQLNDENCVSLHQRNNFMWNDSSCHKSFLPFCRKNSTTTIYYARICPSGCVLIQNSSDFKNSENDCPLHSSGYLVCPPKIENPEYLPSLISVSVIAACLIIVFILGGFTYYRSQRKEWSLQSKSLGVRNQNRAMELSEGGLRNFAFMQYQPPPFLPPPKIDDSYAGYEEFPGSLPSSPK